MTDRAPTLILDRSLRALWPDARISLSIHGVPHEKVHEIGEHPQAVFANDVWNVSGDLGEQYGLSPRLFAIADETCERCRGLIAEAKKEHPEVSDGMA